MSRTGYPGREITRLTPFPLHRFTCLFLTTVEPAHSFITVFRNPLSTCYDCWKTEANYRNLRITRGEQTRCSVVLTTVIIYSPKRPGFGLRYLCLCTWKWRTFSPSHEMVNSGPGMWHRPRKRKGLVRASTDGRSVRGAFIHGKRESTTFAISQASTLPVPLTAAQRTLVSSLPEF